MTPMPPPLDCDKFCRDVEASKAERLAGSGPGGRPRSGAMAAVRQHLATITTLREGGATWPDIGAALTAQGITRRDGGPLTGRHLSALIASIRRQDASRATARAQAQVRRIARADLHHAPEATSATVPSHRDAGVSPPDTATCGDHDRGSPKALFQHLDRKLREVAEADADRPNFSRGLIK